MNTNWKRILVAAALITSSIAAGRDAAAQKVRPVDIDDYNAGIGVTVSGQVLLAPGGYVAGVIGELSAGTFALTASLSRLGYEYEEEGYYESGGATLVNVRGRLYPMEAGQKIWLAGGLAVGGYKTEWGEYNYGYGTETGVAFAPNVGVGFKFVILDNKLAIDPQLLFGVLIGTDSSNPFFGGAGLSVGYKF